MYALNDLVAARSAAAASLWGGGIEVIEQEAIGMHAFTRHMMTCHSEDDDCDGGDGDGDGDDDDDGDDGDGDSDGDGDGSQRKSAKKKFAALQQQMLGARDGGANAAQQQPQRQVDAVNMEELNGGLLDESVRYWTDFQQVNAWFQCVHATGRRQTRMMLHVSCDAARAERTYLYLFFRRAYSTRDLVVP